LQYRCGAKAANELGIDLDDWLTRTRLALDWPEYSKGKYGNAKLANRGMWQGSFAEGMALSGVHCKARQNQW
jgi:hypothetical protein